MAGGTVMHFKVLSCALLTLLLLTLPIHSQGQFCPGERVSSFSCTTEIVHVWSGSALAGQCPSSNPSNGILLSTAANPEGGNVTCGIFTATVTGIVGGMLNSTISFTASSNLDGTEIVCTDSTMTEVESYPILIVGPPTAPEITMVNFIEPRVTFVITWDGTAVVSDGDVTGFQVNSTSGITCDDTSSNPSAMESRCTWEPSAVGQTHSICVSAINCGSQQGGSECISVNLQVPEAPILTTCPVYDDQSGSLLRIESSSTTVPAVDIAEGVDGSPDAYIISFNDTTQEVGTIQCVNGPCTGTFFPPSSAVGPYTVSVTARNVVGEGPADTSGPISDTNDRLDSTVDIDQKRLVCVLLAGFMGSGTTECQIIYGTDDSYSNLPFMDTGNNTSTTITVALSATLQPRTTYYYIVTATSENVCARQQGSFTTECVPDGLVEEGSSLDIVDEGCGPGDSGVLTSAGTGRACYRGTTEGSVATYACNCPSLYTLEGAGTRTCQSDGTWSASVPQCLPQCDSFPNPENKNSHFVGPIDCQPDSPLVNATYGCGISKEDITVHFLTPVDGECGWEDPPCKVVYAGVLGIMGASFYGSILGNIFSLIIGFLCYCPKQKWLIPIILIVSIPLPLVGLAWSWWLVHRRVPVVSSTDKDKSFVRRWWRGIIIAIGVFLYVLYLAIWIALAAIFAPPNVLPSDDDFGLLFAGFAIASITFVFWIVTLNLLCCLRRPVPEGADESDGCKREKRPKKKAKDVEMTTAGEYGKLEHGLSTLPPAPDTSDPMYSHLSADKAGEASAEEYSQLQRKKPPKGVPNISDPAYSHLQAGQQDDQYNELQHNKPPPVPPHVVGDDYSQLHQGAPEYSVAREGPRRKPGSSSKKHSGTDL